MRYHIRDRTRKSFLTYTEAMGLPVINLNRHHSAQPVSGNLIMKLTSLLAE